MIAAINFNTIIAIFVDIFNNLGNNALYFCNLGEKTMFNGIVSHLKQTLNVFGKCIVYYNF